MRRAETVERSLRDHFMMILFIQLRRFGKIGDLLFREKFGIHLVAVRAEERERRFRTIGRDLAVVDVRGDRGERIAVRGIELNIHALRGIGLVRAPDLRAVIHRSEVEPTAARSAALEHDMGIFRREPSDQAVIAEDETVIHLPLPLGRERVREVFRHGAVVVPLDIIDVILFEEGFHLRVNVLHDRVAGKIEVELMPRERKLRAPLLPAERVFGVRAEEIAVEVDHFRLEPDAELHSQLFAMRHDLMQIDLLLIHPPIAQPAAVVRPRAEPAVVQNEQLRADLARRVDIRENARGVKVEIAPFPRVEEHGTALAEPLICIQIFMHEAVKRSAHRVDALVRIGNDRLRRGEPLARGKQPFKILVVDPVSDVQSAVHSDEGAELEIPAVNQVEADRLALRLVRAARL